VFRAIEDGVLSVLDEGELSVFAPLRLCAFARKGLPYSGGGSRQGAKAPRRKDGAIYFSKTINACFSVK
jgi:hypothetical protein